MNIDSQYFLHLLIKGLDAKIATITPSPLFTGLSRGQETRREILQDLRAVLDSVLDASVESGTTGGTVELPRERPIVQHASVVLLSRSLETQKMGVWLAQRLEPGRFNGRWHCPGGGLKPGEAADAAAIRELQEETGLLARKADLNFFLLENRSSQGYDLHLSSYTLSLGSEERPQNTESDLRTNWEWFPLDSVPGWLMPGLAPVLQMLAHRETAKTAKEVVHA